MKGIIAPVYRHITGIRIMYSSVAEDGSEDTSSHLDSVSVASSHRRFGRKRINSELSEPLTSAGASIVDEELGSTGGDPYFVFRKDLQKKLELVDESLADFLRIVHETVGHENCSTCAVILPPTGVATIFIFCRLMSVFFVDNHCRRLPSNGAGYGCEHARV